ncbi:GlxA family transcriptional regulator [Antarcticimicrobium sediminis]|uniref:Helix-turn-helix domain-containing protein n=1 Tax=Antarcticimicrobium sediminis TaxID=2546227 RepID=A0A4R5EPL8_9RHOB|nr:helix-turn-helix domain-containing protein [Antarcticimicrobium sediminis]TDE36594.1 helix-turn-helix domain-containing protein [Antarcticimicrobium sediminis]
MQKRTKSSTPFEIGVLLLPAFSNHCLANVIEPLRAVNFLSGEIRYRWRYFGLQDGEVRSSSGLTVRVDSALDRAEGGDYLFVMPSYDVRTHDTSVCHRALRSARKRFVHLVGLDTGSWLLAGAGLLDGRRATIHREEQIALAERFPEVSVLPDRVVEDGDILSCGGALTSFELVLRLIEQHFGALMRLEVGALFLDGSTEVPGTGPTPTGPTPLPGRTAEAAMALMLRRIEAPVRIEEIAAELGISRKALEQRCRARYGISPRALYRAVRLREVRRLVETTVLSVAEIAVRCGYGDPSAMTRAFRMEFGLPPRALRAQRDLSQG